MTVASGTLYKEFLGLDYRKEENITGIIKEPFNFISDFYSYLHSRIKVDLFASDDFPRFPFSLV